MNSTKAKIVVLLAVVLATNWTFALTGKQPTKKSWGKILFDQKNSLTYQNGLLNYFYDENPTFMNLFELKNVSRPSHFTEAVLIKSRALSYSRLFNDKSYISITVGKFYGFFGKNAFVTDNSKLPIVTNRQWRFFGFEYNRLFFEKPKLKLFYGGGFTYRKGFEYYDVYKIQGGGSFGELITEGVRVRNLGATLNINMRYNFGKRFFLYSKIDTQGYFHQGKLMTDDFQKLNDKWQTRTFTPSSRINHTFTIGVGFDF